MSELIQIAIDKESGDEIDFNITLWQRTIADRIKHQIDTYSVETAKGDGYRDHLGASVIGAECTRYIWYHFRWFGRELHTARMNRIFGEGFRIEAKFREILKARGAQFLDDVDEKGEQIRVSFLEGHCGGSVDGVFIWPSMGIVQPMLLECKSSKTGAPFSDLEKKSMPVAKPRHYVQNSIYGKFLNLEYCLYVCENKNDSDIYCEIVHLDSFTAENAVAKAAYIISVTEPPQRINKKRNYYICNQCTKQELCHDQKAIEPNCRNCKHSEVAKSDGDITSRWFCNKWNAIIPPEEIIKGCIQHQFLPY